MQMTLVKVLNKQTLVLSHAGIVEAGQLALKHTKHSQVSTRANVKET